MSSETNDSSRRVYEARQAASTSAAFFDVSDRTQIEVAGTDGPRFLHSFTSNDIKGLKPGQGCETFITNLKGKVVAHVYALRDADAIWLDGTPGQTDTIVNHLQKYVLIDDVQLKPHSGERGELFITGPLAAQLLQLEDTLPLAGHIRRETDDRSLDIRRVDLLGAPGFLISASIPQIAIVRQGLLAIGIVEGSAELFEAMRIEAGYPQYGRDITDDNLAQEVARTKQCVSFTKGCYLGQETIARLDSMGHTNRELRRIRFEGSVVPPEGSTILNADGTAEVGTLTSAARELGTSPSGETHSVVALGILKRNACQPGTAVMFRLNEQNLPGTVLSPAV